MIFNIDIWGRDNHADEVHYVQGDLASELVPYGVTYMGEFAWPWWSVIDVQVEPAFGPGVPPLEQLFGILVVRKHPVTGLPIQAGFGLDVPRSNGSTARLSGHVDLEDVYELGLDPNDVVSDVYIYRIGGRSNMLCTACYAAGDGRYYSRHEFDAAATDAQIIAHFTACALASEAKLMSVMKSILYDNTGIPDAEPDVEFIFRPLVEFAAIAGETTKIRQFVELRVVGSAAYDVAAWFATNKASLRSKGGTVAETLITNGSNQKQERKPRTS